MWSDEDDQIIGGDLTAALAYVTPAGGAVLTPVSPLGLRDRHAGTVCFSTPVGDFGQKLDRIRKNPRVALAFYAREHGFATGQRFVLVQGNATFDARPDPVVLVETVFPAMRRFIAQPPTGVLWGWWLGDFYTQRLLVTVEVRRIVSWPRLDCSGTPTVVGPAYSGSVEPQEVPTRGAGPRINVAKAARRLRRVAHLLVAYPGADGYPLVVPVSLGGVSRSGIALVGSLAAGGRRAGLLGHSYAAKVIGAHLRRYTGWLQDGLYAPHTESGYFAPASKTLTLLTVGLQPRLP